MAICRRFRSSNSSRIALTSTSISARERSQVAREESQIGSLSTRLHTRIKVAWSASVYKSTGRDEIKNGVSVSVGCWWVGLE